ncbi:hypothetical protein CBW65_22380 [Tumebacillus avium]|uniref:Uncharacterized protein n=1 Tax=Tumebacillus avium TaxID=1903704 RepID=A0A1Y0IVR6_9BACL|nr:hypothetical protein [Tumebacillus avium]ARU63434.1 hypothetical protein CBW65_22380 [Tumebacillus avium]
MMALGQAPIWVLGIIVLILAGFMVSLMPQQKPEGRKAAWVIIGFSFLAGVGMLLTIFDGFEDLMFTLLLWLLAGAFVALLVTMVVKYRGFSSQKRAEFRDFLQLCGWAIGGFLVLCLLLKLLYRT